MHSLGCTKFSIRIKANKIANGTNVTSFKENMIEPRVAISIPTQAANILYGLGYLSSFFQVN